MARLSQTLILGWFLASGGGITAQVPVAQAPRSFTFRVFGQPAPARPVYFQPRPGQVEALNFRSYQRSAAYAYKGPSEMAFARATPVANGGIAYEPFARVLVAPDVREPLLVFLPAPDDSTTPDVLVLDDDAARSPAGHVTVVNRSGFDLRGLIDKRATPLAGGTEIRFATSGATTIQFAVEHQGKLLPAFDQKLSLDQTERTILLLLPPVRSSSPVVRWILLTDEVAPSPESE